MGHSILAFIVVLGVLIFFHELGHFLAARFFKVGVETFSLGFGPKIYRFRKGLTEYCLSLIPLGGYVKMVGEDPGVPVRESDKEISFDHKKLYQKMLIVAAGPLFNFLLAILIFYVIFQISGLYIIKPVVGSVGENSPAMKAGIQEGDEIKAINNVSVDSWDDMVNIISSGTGEPVEILISRNYETFGVELLPEAKKVKNIFGETIDRYMIGISASGDMVQIPLNPCQAFYEGCRKTWEIVELTILSVVKMISGAVSSENMGGPIMIAQMAGEQAEAGMANFAFFIAMLSINLGIINLFPVPVLDGGHLLFFSIEAVRGRAASHKFREKSNQFGMALLVALMVFVFYNDIIRIVKGG
ncbi:MAG: RIP metalloprotease RseP [Thermodesulfobacteriota bacterium]|nr:RIP metalloprotease RseP [Thermodesulfobacteriota bacterium]